MSEFATFDEFKKLGLKAAKVISAEPVEGSEKLLKLQIDLGTEQRQLVSGIAKTFTPEELVGKTIIVASNLEPRKIMGLESQGMLLAAGTENGAILLTGEKELAPGTDIN